MIVPSVLFRLPSALSRSGFGEFLCFVTKQAHACIFGALLLSGILLTSQWQPLSGLSRYDFLFLYAAILQLALLVFRLESWKEGMVILLFHCLATAMELFKTSDAIGSWHYPETSFFRIGNVPLFAGFMYSAVGSYMARAWRLFAFSFTGFPPLWFAAMLAVCAYLNFFSHHFLPDLRWPLIVLGAIAFWRTRIYFTPREKTYSMNLLGGFLLVAVFIYFAENLGTIARAWQYPDQEAGWRPVHFSKLSAWYLLMQLSFILIVILRRIEKRSLDPLPKSPVGNPTKRSTGA